MSASFARALAGSRAGGEFTSSRYRLAVAGLLLLGVALFGGASRLEEVAQVPVRLVAIAVLAASLWPLEFAPLRSNRRLVLFAGACLALPLLQLIPLPPVLWFALPGHAVYAEVAGAVGAVGWRPLSLTPDLTLNALLSLTAPAAAGIAALYLDGNGRKAMAAAFALLALASALLGLAQLGVSGDQLRLYQNTSENAPVGLFANRNHQAALLACAFPLCAAVVPPLPPGRTRLAMIGLIGLAAMTVSAMLLFTGSRMGLLLWVGGVLGAGWTLRARRLLRLPSSRRGRWVWIAGVVTAVAILAVAVACDQELLRRFDYRDIAADTRWAAFPALLTTARAFFPLGSGFGSFASVYPQFEPDALLSTVYLNQAHDEPMQLVIEGGAPALLLVLLFGWWWTRTAARIVSQGRHAAQRGLPRAAVCVTAMLMLSSLVDYPLRTPLLASLFAFCCVSMALRENGDGGGLTPRSINRRRP
jgi:hypothetical protein